MVLADSHGVSRAPCYLGYSLMYYIFGYRTITFYSVGLQPLHLIEFIFFCCPTTLRITVVWAVPFSLAATVGIAIAFFSSGYWDVSIHQVRSYVSINWIHSIKSFLIRAPPDQSLRPAPRSISLVDTPFIASECQGIQLKPLFAYIIYAFRYTVFKI